MIFQKGSLGLHAFDACEKLRKANNPAELAQGLIQELLNFGFEYLTCTAMPGPGQDPRDRFLLNTRPIEYCEHYVEQNHVLRDPVVTELRHTLRPFSWSDVRGRRELTRDELRIIDEGRDYGMLDGLTIPIAATTGGLALIFPSGYAPDLSNEARAAVELIAVTGFVFLQRAVQEQQNRSVAQQAPLTPREREVMQWILAGKTDDEIGTILTIGRSTVRQHADNAMMKLGVYRRTVAIAEALRRGEIHL